jgi:hypothetical protein
VGHVRPAEGPRSIRRSVRAWKKRAREAPLTHRPGGMHQASTPNSWLNRRFDVSAAKVLRSVAARRRGELRPQGRENEPHDERRRTVHAAVCSVILRTSSAGEKVSGREDMT